MANVGSAAAGKTLIGNGNGASPTYASIGTNSGLTSHGVVLAQGSSPFIVSSPGIAGTILVSNGISADPTFQSGGSFFGQTITGDTGGALSPTAGNWNITGTGSITTSGSGSTLTPQLTGLTNHSVLIGAGTATITKVGPTSTAGQVFQSAGSSADPTFSTATYPSTATGTGTILRADGTNWAATTATYPNTAAIGTILAATSANVIGTITAGTNGQVLVGSTGAAPAMSTLTSSDSSISFTTGAGTLSLQVAGGTTSLKTLTGNTGGALSPTAGNINITGTGSITVAGSGSTLTPQLTGITNHALQVGAGTATLTQLSVGSTGQVLQANTTADPTWSTATYPSTTTVSQILYSSATNTVSGLATANNGLLVTSATGVPSVLAGPGATGRVLQSNAAAAPSFSTATFPSTATGTGTILRADGTNWVATTATYPATTTSQQLLYSTATNVIGQLTTANSKFPATNSSGTLAMRALSVVIQTFTATGTYTPTSGMIYCVVEALGGGGGGGGCATAAAATTSSSAGGASGEYRRGVFSAATIGASQAVTINSGGTGGAAGNNAGSAGGSVVLGALITSNGGGGGGGSAAGGSNFVTGSTGGSGGSGGSFSANGASSAPSMTIGTLNGTLPSNGANSQFGSGGTAQQNTTGGAASGYGAGGGGAASTNNQTQQGGGAGTNGIIVVTEYVIA